MTRQAFILLFFLSLTIPSFCQDNYTQMTFQKKTNEKRQKHFNLYHGNYLKIKTCDTVYWGHASYAITDSTFIFMSGNDTILIPTNEIVMIKKMQGYIEGTGYILLGMGMLAFAVGVPIEWATNGGQGAVDQIIGTVAVTSISIPFIVIGQITSRVHMKKWKIILVTHKTKNS